MKIWWNRIKWPLIGAVKDLIAWIFAAFIFPLVQLFIIMFSKNPSVEYENVYNILFVSIASFLTGVFFVSTFWQHNRVLVRMMLVISYIISFGLFIFSLVHVMFNKEIFDLTIYKWGAIIALILAVMVGFFSKYDEKQAKLMEIASEAKHQTKGTIEGKDFKV